MRPRMGQAYARLVERLQRMTALRDAAEMLAWDQQTHMPPGGTPARAAQMAALGATMHDLLASDETGRLLAQAERDEADPDRVAVLRETRFAYDRATKVPSDLVQATAEAQANGFEAWADARRRSDYGAFQPHLARLLDLRRQYAQHVAPDVPAYEALFQDYEPWVPLAEARANLTKLREGLRPLIQQARERGASTPTTFDGDWPVEKQPDLCRRVVAMLGYDLHRGRLDVSPHPFSAGGAHDARITTRYDASTPLTGLLAAIHEAGHAMYMQGLPAEKMGTPLGDARDLIVHESQSRLWENNVGRSLAFWQRVLPMMREAFPGNLARVTAEDAWRAANHVQPSLIRVEADELTYHLHVALRVELEEALVSGKLPVSELPHRWNETMRRDLGLTPPDDAHGVLQDMHWSTGSFGYFPTYSLGSMLSAQLMEAYERGGGTSDDHPALLAWLRANVHAHGKRYKTGDLVERATGKALTPDAFLRYANTKYAQVWA